MHISLPHFQRQTFVESRAEIEFVKKSAINTRNRNRAAFAATVNRLPKRVRAVSCQHHSGFDAVENRVG